MKVSVTAEDIGLGKPRRGRLCPIALAVSRAFGRPACEVAACAHMITIHEATAGLINGRRIAFQTPSSATDFIGRYDCGLAVHPFEFELEESEAGA